jgi:hypothetical protein
MTDLHLHRRLSPQRIRFCPLCGNADVDTLRLEDTADGDQGPDREGVVCERCGLRYFLR